MIDHSTPARSREMHCRVELGAKSAALRGWTDVTVASIDALEGKGAPRFRVRLEAPSGVVTLDLTLGASMAPPLTVGERARARAFSVASASGDQAVIAVEVGGETRLFEGPLDEGGRLVDFAFARGGSSVDSSTGATRVKVNLTREGRHAHLDGSGGFRVLATPTGRWLVSGGHAEGRYGYSVFGVCKLVDNGAARPAQPRPDDDRSAPVEPVEGGFAVRLATATPTNTEAVFERSVSAIEVPDPNAPTTWRVTLAASGWRAVLGLAKALPLVVTLPAGVALPLAVGDVVTVRAFQGVAGIHPRRCVEVRAAGQAVLVEGDDHFLEGLVGVAVSKGPCTSPGGARDGVATRRAGMVRVELDGVAGYAGEADALRSLEAPSGKVFFAGLWTDYDGGGAPPAGASAQTRLTLARSRRAGG